MSGTNTPGNLVVKDPASENDPYGMDWTAYLASLGESVEMSTSSWAVSGGPDEIGTLLVADDEILVGGQITQVYLTGGTPGGRYTVTNTITANTVPVVTDERSFYVLVQHL
jgi:hypothetical protein